MVKTEEYRMLNGQETYPDAHVFVLRIRVSCAFSMRCTNVQFKVRCKRKSTRINARQNHEYPYEMVSASALTNQIALFRKMDIEMC